MQPDAPPPELPSIPKVDAQAHQKRLEEIQAEIDALLEEIKRLKEELKQRKKPPEEAQVMIKPGGSGIDLNPTFVECQPSAIIIHFEGEDPVRVLRAQLPTHERWQQLLDSIADKPKDSIIFLIRENGLGMYYVARKSALEKGVRNGKLPILGHGKIDLSMFRGNRT